VYTGLSWALSPRQPAEAKPNLSQLYASRLSLAKATKLNLFKTLASVKGGGELVSKPVFLSVCRESSEKRWRREAWEFIREVAIMSAHK
jgi:hypothetical protein